ncbi:MAG: primosomal protein N' [Cytophagales bacterium]|jgi:primosomal protein N' (replication factor Y)|nr:primosomal protein N' [Cytophagales bacterium]
MIFYINVIIPIKIDKLLTYHCEKEIHIGSLVQVQVLSKDYVGLVENFSETKPNFSTKPILKILQENCYSETFIQTIKWIAEYYFCPLGLVLKNFLPSFVTKQKFIFSKTLSPSTKILQHENLLTEGVETEDVKKIAEQLKTKSTVLLMGKNRFQLYNFFISKILQKKGTVVILVPNNDYLEKIFPNLKIFEPYLLIFKTEDANKKIANWARIKNNTDPLLLVGTKNILSLPLQKIDFLIIEEEQDDLYLQEQNLPHYNARNVFLYFANLLKTKIILGTNTPSLSTFYNVEKKKYGLFEMHDEEEKKNEISLCKIHMGNQIFTNRSLQEIKKFVNEGKQVIILQNRLGYFDNLICQDCGFCYKCKNCSVGLTFHKKEKILKCHYCWKNYKSIDFCGDCGSENFSRVEMGIEKIFEYLQILFPGKKILQIDAEVIKPKRNKEKILEEIEVADLIIGTRVIENLKFAKATLLVLPDFDRLLTDSDFFSNEKIYKMLAKLKEIPQEKMIIQTSIPEHTIFKNLNDYKKFYEEEISDRIQYKYPPLSRVIEIECKNRDEKLLQETIENIIRDLGQLQVEVLGYERSKIFRMKKKFRMGLWVKLGKNSQEIREVLGKYDVKVFVR